MHASTVLGPHAAPETKSASSAPTMTDVVGAMDRQTAAIADLATKMTPAAAQAKAAATGKSVKDILDNALAEIRATKAANDRRPDALLDEKQRRINLSMDATERAELKRLREENAALQRKSRRPHGPTGNDPASRAAGVSAKSIYRAATTHYLRTGQATYKGEYLGNLATKAATRAVAADGGFLVIPEHDEGPIEKALRDLVPWRQHFDVKPMTSAILHKPFRTGTGGAVWGTEMDNQGERPAPTWAELQYQSFPLYAELRFSRELVEDSAWDIESEMAEAAKDDFADTENTIFVTGDGNGKPRGFMAHAAGDYIDETTTPWVWGKFGTIKSGHASQITTESIVGLGYLLAPAYRNQAKFLMSRSTIHACRVLKGADGHFIWANGSMVQGQPATLDGREVIEAEAMPAIGAGTMPIAIADTKRAYTIYDRIGMQVLVDDKQPTHFRYYVRKRVAGGVKDFKAIKFLKIAA